MDHAQLSSIVLKSPLGLTPAFPVNLNAVPQGSSPLLSPVLSDAGGARIEEDDEMKRKVRAQSWAMLVPGGELCLLGADCVVFCGGCGQTPVLKVGLDVLCCCDRSPQSPPGIFLCLLGMATGTISLCFSRSSVSGNCVQNSPFVPQNGNEFRLDIRERFFTPRLIRGTGSLGK